MFLHADKSLREVIRVIVEKPTALKAMTTPGKRKKNLLNRLNA